MGGGDLSGENDANDDGRAAIWGRFTVDSCKELILFTKNKKKTIHLTTYGQTICEISEERS
jgi:hypothetical protein